MSTSKLIGFILSVILLFLSLGMARQLDIIPRPQEVTFKADSCSFTGQSITLEISSADSAAVPAGLKQLRNACRKYWDRELLIRPRHSEKKANFILEINKDSAAIQADFGCSFTSEMQAEGYLLQVAGSQVQLVAQTPAGLFNGLMTLVQLVKSHPAITLPGLLIKDYPDLAWRGVSDDISRGQVSTMENFQAIIRYLAEYKMNIYMPYLEDLVQLEKYPDISAGRGGLSAIEIKALQQYADQYFITIIPIFQTLGHYENILNMPGYRQYADFPGAASLNVLSKKADRFLFNLLEEVIPMFSSNYFHIGCDESWDVGLGATYDAAQELGTAELHARHYQKVYNKVRDMGKEVLMYGDIILRHPEILDLIPKDIIIVDWHYYATDQYPSVKKFKEAGFKVLVSPGIYNWRNPVPNNTRAWINISNLNYEGYRQGALGSITSNWGDYGGPNFREMNYLGYAYGAETAWNPDGADGSTINQRFMQQFWGTQDPVLHSLLLHLDEMPHYTDYKKIWRQPFYEKREHPAEILFKAAQLRQHATQAQQLIAQIRGTLDYNQDKLDYYEFGAQIGNFTGAKLAFARRIAWIREHESGAQLSEKALQELIRTAEALIRDLTRMEKRYVELWRRTNRDANLSRMINLFRHQRAYFAEALVYIKKREFNIPAEIPALWIAAQPYEPEKPISPAYLRTKFNLPDTTGLQKAYLQLIGNSDATLYLNGRETGRVIATKTLSLWVENQRVGAWEVSRKLQPGENYLAVAVQGYKPGRPSAANVYLELNFQGDSTRHILSDTTWQATTEQARGWQIFQDENLHWQPAMHYTEYPWRISRPLFQRGFASRIEF